MTQTSDATGTTSDVHVTRTVPLTTPELLAQELPLEGRALETVLRYRREVQAILRGEDSRYLVISGPCSIHDEQAALAYADKFAALA
ncbi:MAG: 3-deoxy-7-phosphoheptulonate synthase, partial [Chloroflexi bacterium]|nr:3-deoxy-7-phosphoheptulonate synthase [Chloroflexota bacterium]